MLSVAIVGCSKIEAPVEPTNQGTVAEAVTESEAATVLETASEPVTSSE